MSWAIFYLVCFVIGLVFSLLSVVGNFGRLSVPRHLHLPHFLGHRGPVMHVGHIGSVHSGGPHAPPLSKPALGGGAHGSHVSFFNISSLMAFLAWFGGTGYLLTRYAGLVTVVTFGLALAGGFVAAGIVFLFLVKVLLAHEAELDPSDFAQTGILGKLNVAIRAGGTGEIVFSRAGARHCSGARSDNGRAIAKGTEVIVTRYEKGIAYVRRYDELAEESGLLPQVTKGAQE